ncbi:alpha-ketoglutarate-dependent dioxygenase AlkB family protein [Oricola cellulosilytica]|uniref:Alpha-ketoglutarate-dependent dioxygenase AlkB n=1 Tax=Oricola cellulosilytica TaxID=1429082 RepID=A0A4R0PGH8_9HYPH|nr:alpha-ketoglutarate-dependent dioxygenase AlkB [Oricola cellulosilytica]TCD16013.1 alpha-ketoglutarate-dependent dioxygenase AlkB [Oricola cellulosilytica]
MEHLPQGLKHIASALPEDEQRALLDEIRNTIVEAPLYVPMMPRTGKPLGVKMTNCGELGWLTDKEKGYRYESTHPVTGRPWPPIPTRLLRIWNKVSGYGHPPEACLINFYEPGTKMGLHQDRDEDEFAAPVVSISLGDTCLFRIGGTTRKGRTSSLKLASGDIVVMGGDARLSYHGVDRVYPGTSTLLKNGGRINLTLRRVTRP